jgi:hypothetical protein
VLGFMAKSLDEILYQFAARVSEHLRAAKVSGICLYQIGIELVVPYQERKLVS